MSASTLNNPAWFGAVMGLGGIGAVAALNPGGFAVMDPINIAVAIVSLTAAILVFLLLLGRALISGLARKGTLAAVRRPTTGPAFATIPGGVAVVALLLIHLDPRFTNHGLGWWVIAVFAILSTLAGLWLTIAFFAATFEDDDFAAEHVTGIWFIPETVVILGAVLATDLADSGPAPWARTFTVIALLLLGCGAVLFGFTASLFINRLVLYPQARNIGAAPAMWIMVSPMSVTALALHEVGQSARYIGGDWQPAVQATMDVMAALLWGFSLWWLAAAAVITYHVGRSALRFTPASWAYVFPPAAMTITALTLGRYWGSGFMEGIGMFLALCLAVVTCWVCVGAVRSIRSDRHQAEAPAA